MSVEILRDGVFKPLPENIAAEVKAAFAKGRRGRIVECTFKSDSELAYDLYQILFYKYYVKPTREEMNWITYTGFKEYVLRINGKIYKLRVEFDYINSCYNKSQIWIGVQKSMKLTLKKIR